MVFNTQADQLCEIQNEVKKNGTKDYDREKPIKNEFMRIIFLFVNLLSSFTGAVLGECETRKFIDFHLEYSTLTRYLKSR